MRMMNLVLLVFLRGHIIKILVERSNEIDFALIGGCWRALDK